MAEKMLSRGWEVVGYDVKPSRREALAAAGGRPVATPAEVFAAPRPVMLSLPTSGIVSQLTVELADALGPGTLLIDTTTGDPEEMMAIAKKLAVLGVDYVEATVAGSSTQVLEGTAVLYLGGEEAVVARVEAILEPIAGVQFRLGDVGAASRFKLVHNLLLGLHRAALAETLLFGEALGFEAQRTLEILRVTPAASVAMQAKGQKMVSRDYEPHARLAQHLKDVRLILAEAERHGAKTPLSEKHRELLERAVELGYGDADNTAVIEGLR